MGVLDFSFSFQLWQTAREYKIDQKEKNNRKSSKSGRIVRPETKNGTVEVLRESSKVLRW
tara:strand:+ start:1430 stop:1609 length:180 start_codon:yes stop_codon:yes gene_type:complete